VNKDFRHKVKSSRVQRRVANAYRRTNHHRDRREAQREIREALCQ